MECKTAGELTDLSHSVEYMGGVYFEDPPPGPPPHPPSRIPGSAPEV